MSYAQYAEKALGFMASEFELYESSNGWMNFDCPICDKPKKGCYNVKMMHVKCWVCGYDESLIMFAANYLRKSESAIKRLINDADPREIDSDEFKEAPIKRAKRFDEIDKPDGFKELIEGDDFLARKARRYLKTRGFDIMQLNAMGFGYVSDTSALFYGYIIIPFFVGGVFSYYIGRDYLKRGEPLRYKNPEKDICGVGKGDLWFNQDALKVEEVIYIVEGWSDAQTLGPKGIASCGYTWSPTQRMALFKSPCKRFVIIPDRGKYSVALNYASDLLTQLGKEKVKVLNLDDRNLDGKDVNSIGIVTIRKMIKAESYMNDSEVFVKILSHA